MYLKAERQVPGHKNRLKAIGATANIGFDTGDKSDLALIIQATVIAIDASTCHPADL